jgi:galactokinase/mevalonate kinase-like predicted kinase
VHDEKILRWIEDHLFLVALGPRKSGFSVLKGTRITPPNVLNLARAANDCWKAILRKDEEGFGRQMRNSFEAQVRMFPRMADDEVRTAISQYAGQALGWKLSGAGGGGYLVLVSHRPIPGAIKLKIRRKTL